MSPDTPRPPVAPALTSPLVVTVVVGVCWLALPFTAGDTIDAALAGRAPLSRWVVGVGVWTLWALGAAVLAVPRTTSLTAARFVVPAGLATTVAAAVVAAATNDGDAPGFTTAAGITLAAAATVLVLSAPFADRAVNGSSYGAERRFALRPTAAMVAVAPLLWVIVAGAVATGPLLVAAGVVIPGIVVWAVGWPTAGMVVRRAHILARRWLVLVPVGVVVHDPLVLSDSLLIQRRTLAGIGPAPADTTARDLTGGAFGLALEVRVSEPTSFLTNAARREAGGSRTALGEQVGAVLVAPSRPGAVMAAVAERRLPPLR